MTLGPEHEQAMKRVATIKASDLPPTLAEAIRAVDRELQASGVQSPRLDARLIVSHAAGVRPETSLTDPDRELDMATREQVASLVMRRMAREPVSHILGHREFWSLDFNVTPHTLTPRPDTECLVEAVLEDVGGRDPDAGLSVLDLGTGTGCILLALLSEIPHANGLGVDISTDALDVAGDNARRHGLDGRCEFRAGDWFSPVQGCFDVIISNPPYIESGEIARLDPEVANHEPMLALDGGADGLMCYRDICSKAPVFMKSGGLIALEVGAEQSEDVGEILADAGFLDVRVRKDLAGLNRVVMATCP